VPSATLIFRLARRNLALNARRSLLIGTLVAFAVMISVIGNSLFDSTLAGIRRTFINCFTGDLYISGKSDRTISLFGVDTPVIGSYTPIPVIPGYESVLAVVRAQPGLSGITSQLTGYALLESAGVRVPVALFGVDGDEYFKSFPAIRVARGALLHTGVPGLMISRGQAEEIQKTAGHPPAPGDSVTLSAYTGHGFTIRQVPLAGIFDFPATNTVLDRITYVDTGTLRSLNGVVEETAEISDLPAGATSYVEGDLTNVFDSEPKTVGRTSGVQISDVEHSLADRQARAAGNGVGKGSWNFILIKLEPETDPALFQRNLESQLKAAGLDARVGDWKAAAGSGAALAGSLSLAFDAGLLLLAVVIVFVLVNTLVIWVTQRTAEIGTIRALGGSRRFVFELFFTESTILSVVSGAAGVIVGSALVLLLSHKGLTIDNRILELIFGGKVLRPVLTLRTTAVSFLGALIVGALAVIFPIRMALKIRPVRAMGSE
jgi:putative ABC transport system permease protein